MAPAHAAADHTRERSGEPVHRAARTAVGNGMEARDAGPSMYARSRSGQPIPPAPPSGDTGIGSAMGWINLNYASSPAFRFVWSCCPSPFGDPKGDTLRMSSAIGFNPVERGRRPPMPIRVPHLGIPSGTVAHPSQPFRTPSRGGTTAPLNPASSSCFRTFMPER